MNSKIFTAKLSDWLVEDEFTNNEAPSGNCRIRGLNKIFRSKLFHQYHFPGLNK